MANIEDATQDMLQLKQPTRRSEPLVSVILSKIIGLARHSGTKQMLILSGQS